MDSSVEGLAAKGNVQTYTAGSNTVVHHYDDKPVGLAKRKLKKKRK